MLFADLIEGTWGELLQIGGIMLLLIAVCFVVWLLVFAYEKRVARNIKLNKMVDQVAEIHSKLMTAKFIPDRETSKVADDQGNG